MDDDERRERDRMVFGAALDAWLIVVIVVVIAAGFMHVIDNGILNLHDVVLSTR